MAEMAWPRESLRALTSSMPSDFGISVWNPMVVFGSCVE
jgi:hypothetical protein